MTEFNAAALRLALQHWPVPARYCVAYSGGLDSHALLHALVTPGPPPAAVYAVHIDHGLAADSRLWSEHCASVCANLHIPYRSIAVDVNGNASAGPEAAARQARYGTLADVSEPGDYLLTAHHQDDLAETVLLHLLRGSGVKGLAGIPPFTPFAQGHLVRPLLEFSRADLHAYAERHRLQWLEDPSNAETHFYRNYLRHEILPRMRHYWPAAARGIARAASHQREADELLDDLARIDLHNLHGPYASTLRIQPLLQLTPARRANVLRYWLRSVGLPAPAATHLEQITEHVLHSAQDACPCLCWPGAELRRYRDLLYALHPLPPHDSTAIHAWNLDEPLSTADGTLRARREKGAGVAATLCASKTPNVRYRRGGERCRPTRHGHTHTLKHLFQEAGIAPWQRDRIPLLFLDDQLAAIAGLCVCEPFQAQAGEWGWALDYLIPGRKKT